MAVNNLTQYIQPLLAAGMRTFRQRIVLPRLVNREFDRVPGQKYSTIQIPIPSAIVATDVVPGHVAPDTDALAPTFIQLVMDQWKEAAFTLTDADLMKVRSGIIPMAVESAAESLAMAVNSQVWTRVKGIGNFAGTPGTTPFASDLSVYVNARKILNKRNIPKSNRFAIIDEDAAGNAIQLRAFQDKSWRGDDEGIIEGEIGRKLGATWFSDNAVPYQATVALTAGAATVNGVNAKGSKVVSIAKATNASNLVAGDIITIAHGGLTGNVDYAVDANVTLIVGNTAVTLSEGLRVATAGGEAVTLRAAHVKNALLHRDAIAFGTRPLAESTPADGGGLGIFDSIVDEESGLILRLELTREFKQWRWSYDVMWGSALVRPEAGAIMAG
jgi:hypothetical protein